MEKHDNREKPAKNALIVLGCPQIPIQTSAALYLVYRLEKTGVATTVAGTKSARALLEVADPEQKYLRDLMDLDHCIGLLAEHQVRYDLCFVFVHNDAGIAYSATVASLLDDAKVFSILFGESTKDLLAQMEGIPCEPIIAPGSHNPTIVRKKLDEVIAWVASKR